jgi:hypothetical protein
MAFDRFQDGFLSLVSQDAQSIGKSRADGPLVYFPLNHGRESCCQSQAAHDPRFATIE